MPQWIGTATRGCSSPSASAALRAFRCPAGSRGPQPATGSSATSSPARARSCRRRGRCRPRSSARRTLTTYPTARASVPSGLRRPGCSAASAGSRPRRAEPPRRRPPRHVRAKPRLRSSFAPPSGTTTRTSRPSRRSDGEVEVVVVEVRDEHGVEPADRGSVDGRPDHAAECATRLAQDGSVSSRTPSSSSRTVLWPIQVIRSALDRVGCESSRCGTAPSTSTGRNHRIRFGRHGRHPDRTKARLPANGSPRPACVRPPAPDARAERRASGAELGAPLGAHLGCSHELDGQQ